MAMARRVLSAHDVDWLESVAPAQRHRAFLRLWARKEAYLRGLGVGLRADLDVIDVAGNGSAFVPVADRSAVPAGPVWWVHDLDAGEGYAAALAIPGSTAALDLLPRIVAVPRGGR